MAQFAVVHFYVDNSVEAVPSTWLTVDKTSCYWPKKIPANFKSVRDNPLSIPGEVWEIFEILVVKFSGKFFEYNYHQAIKI